jgi:hypothetical protein
LGGSWLVRFSCAFPGMARAFLVRMPRVGAPCGCFATAVCIRYQCQQGGLLQLLSLSNSMRQTQTKRTKCSGVYVARGGGLGGGGGGEPGPEQDRNGEHPRCKHRGERGSDWHGCWQAQSHLAGMGEGQTKIKPKLTPPWMVLALHSRVLTEPPHIEDGPGWPVAMPAPWYNNSLLFYHLTYLTPLLPRFFWGVPGGGRGVCGGVRSANQLKVTR